MSATGEERLRRWRLVLGGDQAEGTGAELEGTDLVLDDALDDVYGATGRGSGLGGSAPRVARWLGDVRRHFPSSVVQVLQRDALERHGLRELLLEPELLSSLTPDAALAADLIALGDALPERARTTAREVVRQVVLALERRLADRLVQAVTGALDRTSRTTRPRSAREVDWNRTIRANLRHYQPEYATVVPERLLGWSRRRQGGLLREVILLVDQSGSMATSVVHAGVLACVLASVRSLRTSLVVFDTAVVDLTERLDADPVDVLFGVQLGGGTDIDQALAYAQTLVVRPAETVLVLVSDLLEGGDQRSLLRRIATLVRSGVTVVVLLALSDDGAPAYSARLAADVTALGAVTMACTPDAFPDLMAAALRGDDVAAAAVRAGLAPLRGSD